MMKKVLSVFIDESGDFGAFDKRAPFYLVALVFHSIFSNVEFRKVKPVEWE